MRLLSKTTLLIVTVSIFIFMTGNIVFFHISKGMINNHIDAELIREMYTITERLKTQPTINDDFLYYNNISIDTVSKKLKVNPTFSDTVLYGKMQNRYIPHRSLKFTVNAFDKNQLIIIHKSLLSSDNLIERITVSSIIMVMVFIVMIYVMNRYVFSSVWSNFFSSLQIINNYDIKSDTPIQFKESQIVEFERLNSVLKKMVIRIQTDYKNLKELTANTSHEIQTPLAIIKSKAELLLQSDNLIEKELETVYSILNTSDRLSKLNQSLLLITKIENNQFEDCAIIELDKALEKYLDNFEILFEAGSYQLKLKVSKSTVCINPVLLDVLITNFLKNALTHGTPGGEISVRLSNDILQICNDGDPLPFNSDMLFKRFVKRASGNNSSGLGLEIVKKISDYYSIPINYEYHSSQHCFSINFKNIVS